MGNYEMDIVLLSNFLNHHMLPLCTEFKKLTKGKFAFIATEEIPEERIRLGYKSMNEEYDFVVCAYKNKSEYKKARQICKDCKVLIYGSAPESLYMQRLAMHRLTFRYSERVIKKPLSYRNIPRNMAKFLIRDALTQYSHHYMLCASAYTADDFNRFGAFKNRCFKWGYFPPTNTYDAESLQKKKGNNQILWVGRLIPYKQPILAVEVADKLKEKEIPFTMKIVGDGELLEKCKEKVKEKGLEGSVSICGSKSNEEVRELMEETDIFLFTSNEEEGWGAVLNEAMDSCCACIAYEGIGSVPFMLNESNGIIYNKHDPELIAEHCEDLLSHHEKAKALGEKAKKTIEEVWNAREATRRFLMFVHAVNRGEIISFEEGPMSKAARIRKDPM